MIVPKKNLSYMKNTTQKNKTTTHSEILNSNILLDQKIFLQKRLKFFNNDFDKLLEDMEKACYITRSSRL